MRTDYNTFEKLREKAEEKLHSFDKVDKRYLNDLGLLVYRVYDILDDCYRLSNNKTDLAELVRDEIKRLADEDKAGNKETIESLVRYITWNLETEYWRTIPEFRF